MKTKRADRYKKIAAAVAGVMLGVGLLAGSSRACADLADAWGNNYTGQLGNGSNINSNVPVAVSGMTSAVTAIAAGNSHSLAIRNGAAWAWGDNSFGQLGNGTNTASNAPVGVSILTSGVTAIAGGVRHSLAIQNGGAVAWGYNANGQLGNGTNTASNSPVAASGLTSGVTAIAGGGYHSLAIQNGAAVAWGDNANGQLGNGTNTSSNSPVAVSGLTSGVTAIAGGTYHSLAIQNGAAVAWGYNMDGELGNGTSGTIINVPVAVSGLTSNVTAIAGGTYHSLAIQNGYVYAWGDNSNGQLGNGGYTASSVPLLINSTNLHGIVDVAAGDRSSYALSADGTLWVWGENSSGQLGLGTFTNYLMPQHLLPPSGYIFTGIDAGMYGSHALATLAPVPEPASLSLLAIGGLTLLRRRRRP